MAVTTDVWQRDKVNSNFLFNQVLKEVHIHTEKKKSKYTQFHKLSSTLDYRIKCEKQKYKYFWK